MNYNFKTYILLFFTYSIAGWLMESVKMIFNKNFKKFVNRGFLIGPYLPIYGYGVVAITVLLSKYKDDILALFFLSICTCGILEYLTSYVMEKIFNARWWDYSQRKFNINGRVCLETLIPFGIAGVLVVEITNPILFKAYTYISSIAQSILAYTLVSIIAIDTIISYIIIYGIKKANIELNDDDDTVAISNIVKDKTEDLAMQLESDIKRNKRKTKLRYKRKILHAKLRASKDLRKLQYNSKAIQKKIDNKISTIKTNSEERTKLIKEKFAEKSFLHKRIITAFPDLQLKEKIKNKINKK